MSYEEEPPVGWIRLYVLELPENKTMIKNVAFDIYCKFTKKEILYHRFDNVTFDISDKGKSLNKDYIGLEFDMVTLKQAFVDENGQIRWEFTIRCNIDDVL